MNGVMRTTVLGARGSLPNNSPETQRYGGGTTCLSIECGDGSLIVLDAGTGIVDLGWPPAGARRELHLFFTHTHWDHVLGLPYLKALWDPEAMVHIHGVRKAGREAHGVLLGLFHSRHFPVPRSALPARLVLDEVEFGDVRRIGGAEVLCCRANHPGFALGFRVTFEGRSLFFASDTAPFCDVLFRDRYHERERTVDEAGVRSLESYGAEFRAALRGVDVAFLDSHFTDEQYELCYHWGHSSMRQSYELARECGVGRLVLWHHDRRRGDLELERLAGEFIERGRREGLVVDLAEAGRCYELG